MALDKLLLECLGVPIADAQDFVCAKLEEYGYKPFQGGRFTWAEGATPALLVAHTDTVWDEQPKTVYHDAAKTTIWGGKDGLGADDRCGVYAIFRLLDMGWRPHVLFPDEEEVGGRGAEEAGGWPAPPVRVMIQLDRQGANDAVTYSHAPQKGMRRWLKRHGFEIKTGTFSDISVLMPDWKIAGVNLSIGYYGQHTQWEHCNYAQMEQTIERVDAMLADLPQHVWRYRERFSRRDYFTPMPRRPYLLSHTPLVYKDGDTMSELDRKDIEWWDEQLRKGEKPGGYHAC